MEDKIVITKSLASGMRNHGAIVGTKGELLGQILRMGEAREYVIGRDEKSCDMVLRGEKISRVHCKIYYDSEKQKYTVADCSTNGTYVSGKLLGKDNVIDAEPGSKICLGDEEQEVRLG